MAVASWTAAWRAYDDDTLTALANAGLLRRAAKDVEAGKLQWLEQGADAGVIEADGQQVKLDARGPQQAVCNCPAPGICKHILGAALWLRSQSTDAATPDDPPSPSDVVVAEETAHAAADPLAEVLALESAPLFKSAGLAAVRRVAALPLTAIEWRQQDAVLVMDLAQLGQSCRWVSGAGFDGMVSEVPARERKAVHLMALAALRAALGQPLEWPEGMAPVPSAEVPVELSRSESAFIDQVQATLHELLTGGLAHVSPLTSARLLALNMSARGEGLPRLAALLRNLGGTVDLLVARDHRAQERDALAMLSQLYALCEAMRAVNGDLLAALRGRIRRDFDEAAALETLLPLGAHWWKTAGGARGISLALWDVENARLLQAVLARPDGSDVGFTRHSAWNTQSLWPGSGAAEQICKTPLKLLQPRLADDLRLAVGGITRAGNLPRWSAQDERIAGIGLADWQLLHEQLREATGLAAEPLDMVLLRPATVRAPLLDEAAQMLRWQVQDAVGHWLALAIPVSDANEQRMETLERLMAAKVQVVAVLARVERSAAQCLLIPVAMLSADEQGLLRTISLDFESAREQTTPLAGRILRMLKLKREASLAPVLVSSMSQRLLAPLFEVLETQAATGRMQLTDNQRQSLQTVLPVLDSVGWQMLAQAVRVHLTMGDAASLLRAHRLASWLMELDSLPGYKQLP